MSASMKSLGLAVMAALCLPSLGCEEEGPMERAGRAIDDAAESAKESMEDLVEEDGPLERAGRKMDESIEEAKKSLAE